MKKQLMGMVLVGTLAMSASAMAEDGGHSKLGSYSRMIEKEYSFVQIEDKSYELEYELKNLDNLMLLEVEVEDSFLGKNHTDLEVQKNIEPIIEKIATEIIDDFEKPVKVVVEYEDRNVLIKKY